MDSFFTTRVYDLAEETGIPYDYLICMMYELKCEKQSQAFYYNQLDIPYLPPKIINLLWPVETVNKVVELFWEVYDRVEIMETAGESYPSSGIVVWQQDYVCWSTWPDLKNCWLFKTLSLWVNDDKVSFNGKSKLKKTLFELAFVKQSRWMVNS